MSKAISDIQDNRPVLIDAAPHPFRPDVYTCEMPYGLSIAEMLPNARSTVHVMLGGVYIPREQWARVRPKPGAHLHVGVMAGDGGGGDDGNKVVRTMLQIVVAVAAMYTGQYYMMQGSMFTAAVVSVGIAAVGNFAIYKMLPPQLPESPALNAGQTSFNRKYSLTGTRNQMLPYGVVPRVYGKHRYYPPYAAKPFTELVGEDQYLRVLLMLGYGPLDISDIRIGQTPIAEYDDVEYEIGESPSLFSNDVSEEQLALTWSSLGDLNVAHTRTTIVNTDEISVDFAFPQGLFGITSDGQINDVQVIGGRTAWAFVRVLVEYRLAGSADPWLNAVNAAGMQMVAGAPSGMGWTTATTDTNPRVTMNGSVRETRRCSMRWKVPTGQYDVRITKVEHDVAATVTEDDRIFREMVWTTLRSVSYKQPSQIPNTLLMAMRIKATDQLQSITDAINMVAEAKLLVWDGVKWVEQKTRDPAWAYLDVPCGLAAKKPLDKNRFNIDELKAWADDNVAKGRYFDAVIDSQTTKFDVMKAAAAAGRATYSNKAGLHTVVRDTVQNVPKQVFTPRNSWGFSGVRNMQRLPHYTRVRWTNPDIDWQEDEIIVYADGYDENTADPANYDELQLRGVTDYTQAWRAGRYHLKELYARRDVWFLSADIEHIACERGDLVHVQQPTLKRGIAAARIKSTTEDINGDATAVVIDEVVEMFAGRSYVLRIRRQDGTQVLQPVQTVAGETSELTFTAPVQTVNEGDLVAFGETDLVTVAAKVKDIRRSTDISARLQLAPVANEIHSVDDEIPPPHTSAASNVIDPAYLKCNPPVLEQPGSVTNIRSGSQGATEATGGIMVPGLTFRVAYEEQ